VTTVTLYLMFFYDVLWILDFGLLLSLDVPNLCVCGRHRIRPDLNHLAMRQLWHCAPPMTWRLAENGDI
jgi:hypothetical protein